LLALPDNTSGKILNSKRESVGKGTGLPSPSMKEKNSPAIGAKEKDHTTGKQGKHPLEVPYQRKSNRLRASGDGTIEKGGRKLARKGLRTRALKVSLKQQKGGGGYRSRKLRGCGVSKDNKHLRGYRSGKNLLVKREDLQNYFPRRRRSGAWGSRDRK